MLGICGLLVCVLVVCTLVLLGIFGWFGILTAWILYLMFLVCVCDFGFSLFGGLFFLVELGCLFWVECNCCRFCGVLGAGLGFVGLLVVFCILVYLIGLLV